MKIILVRHGDRENLEGDISLNHIGKIQAQLVAKELMKYPISKIYSSDYLRAKETAEIYASLTNKKVILTDKLREIYRVIIGGPEREGTSDDRIEKDIQRADEIFGEFLKSKENIVVFCHENIIIHFLNKVMKSKENLWSGMTINNTGISIIESSEEELKILAVNLITHLPKEMLSKFYL
jgi:broad specificity phosphatase PhoE